jgi:hypothetical protein
MQIINKIDKLISQLNGLKPDLSNDFSSNEKKFTELLKSNIENNNAITNTVLETSPSPRLQNENGIPSWVDQDYGYDPMNPRKPNMRELMEAISGKDLDGLYTTTEQNWQKVSNEASEVLYGVVGSNADTRNWQHIMESENILESAQEQTGAMYEPTVEVLSNFDENNTLKEQLAVIKDKDGNTLRLLSNNLPLAEEALRNFGANRDSIPKDLGDKVNPNVFDKNLLTFLKNFDTKTVSADKMIIQSAGEIIANKLSLEIPIEELEKL